MSDTSGQDVELEPGGTEMSDNSGQYVELEPGDRDV